MATLNQGLSKDAIELLAADYGMDAEEKNRKRYFCSRYYYFEEAAAEGAGTAVRPPVVTIMGTLTMVKQHCLTNYALFSCSG